MENLLTLLITIALAFVLLVLVIPHSNRAAILSEILFAWHAWRKLTTLYAERGGYVHDASMTQYIPPTAMMPITGTWTEVAGQVAGTIVKHKAAAADTSVVYIPVVLMSNSAVDAAGLPSKGSLLKSIEVDYEVLVAAATSVTFAVTKVKRGADTAVAVVSTPASTQDLAAATAAATVDQHKCTITLTTPAYIENDEYYIVTMTIVAAATTQIDVLGAFANFTFKA